MGLFQDLRFGVRTLLRSPVFTTAAVVCIALGIGANTAVFAFLYGIVLEPLPYPDSKRLVSVLEQVVERGWTDMSLSWPDYLDWRDQNATFDGLAAYDGTSFNVTGRGEPERIGGAFVSWNILDVLRTPPEHGRGFRPEEDQPGAPGTVLLGYTYWRDRFGADPAVIGSTVSLQGEPFTVIGVMPLGFRFPESSNLWVPFRLGNEESRGSHWLRGVGRLKDGIDEATARQDLDGIAARLEEAYPESNAGVTSGIESLKRYFTDDSAEPALIFYVVVCFVLLIACTNVANLMLARASSREKELAVRASLGAGRLRIARLLMIESLLVASFGGAIGIVLGRFGRDGILSGIPVDIPVYIGFEMKPMVILVMVGVTLLTGVLFGLVPAVRAMRFDVSGTLREGNRGGGGRRRQLFRQVLVGGEIALALTLLIAAGLSVKGLVSIQQVDPVFEERGLLTLRVSLPGDRYPTPSSQIDFYREVRETLGRAEGARSVAGVSFLPMSGSSNGNSYRVEGSPEPEPGRYPVANHAIVTPRYFETMQIPVIEGREFTEQDRGDFHPIAIVGERLARRYWPTEPAVGKRISYGPESAWMTIVGVVADVRQYGRDSAAPETIYRPFAQLPRGTMSLAVRFGDDPYSHVQAVRSAVWSQDPELPVWQIRSMRRVMQEGDWEPPFYAWMFTVFSVIALVLSAVGIYGVVAYSVGQRTREFGIRMALGAGQERVLALVMRQGLVLTLIGSSVGLLGAWWLMQFTASILEGVNPRDLFIYGATTLIMGSIALLATWLPARRATQVSPVEALRNE